MYPIDYLQHTDDVDGSLTDDVESVGGFTTDSELQNSVTMSMMSSPSLDGVDDMTSSLGSDHNLCNRDSVVGDVGGTLTPCTQDSFAVTDRAERMMACPSIDEVQDPFLHIVDKEEFIALESTVEEDSKEILDDDDDELDILDFNDDDLPDLDGKESSDDGLVFIPQSVMDVERPKDGTQQFLLLEEDEEGKICVDDNEMVGNKPSHNVPFEESDEQLQDVPTTSSSLVIVDPEVLIAQDLINDQHPGLSIDSPVQIDVIPSLEQGNSEEGALEPSSKGISDDEFVDLANEIPQPVVVKAESEGLLNEECIAAPVFLPQETVEEDEGGTKQVRLSDEIRISDMIEQEAMRNIEDNEKNEQDAEDDELAPFMKLLNVKKYDMASLLITPTTPPVPDITPTITLSAPIHHLSPPCITIAPPSPVPDGEDCVAGTLTLLSPSDVPNSTEQSNSECVALCGSFSLLFPLSSLHICLSSVLLILHLIYFLKRLQEQVFALEVCSLGMLNF